MSNGTVLLVQKSVPQFKRTLLLSLLAFLVSLSSSLVWRVSDIDFVTKIGSGRLAIVYIYAAVIVFVNSSFTLLTNRKISSQAFFYSIQKSALIGFGIIAATQLFFFSCQDVWLLYLVKVFGYAYSILLFNAFWIALDPCNERAHPSKLQTSLYSISLYLGMASAGLWLQTSNLTGISVCIIACICSFLCCIIGRYAFQDPLQQSANGLLERASPNFPTTAGRKILSFILGSKMLIALVLISLLFSILVRCAEYSFIADFEIRYLSIDNSGNGWRSIGSFVTLIGLGNIITLISWQIWSKYIIGKAGLPIATILAFFVINYGSNNNYPLATSVCTLIIVESLYAIVVESSLQHLLEYFDEQDRSATRIIIDAVVDPMALLLSALLFLMPGFSLSVLGVSVALLACLSLLYTWYVGHKVATPDAVSFRTTIRQLSAFGRKKKDRATA